MEIEVLTTIEEAKQCARLMTESDPWITLKRNYNHCLKLFLDRSRDIFILKDAEKVIAFCVVHTNCFPQPYIKSLGVHADYRRKGIGNSLLKFAEEKYGGINGKIFIAVSSFNNDARKLYERAGYRKVGEFDNYATVGHSEIILQKSLAEKPKVVNKGPVYVSTDKNEMDVDFIFDNLKNLYWTINLTRENLAGRILNSICFGVFANGKQVGFARVVTDYFSFAYLADVFVTEKERGKGYSRVLIEYILEYPVLKDIKWLLATRDMHGLYAKFGFTGVGSPDRFMGKNGWKSF
ncbi:MAG: GNAT family N-acetyltransferase [Chitinophagaceae bacterium]|nr:GNAT family N-acetyltransferase [Chitinophagaceae bacterium]